MDENELVARGYKIHRNGKMVPDGLGGLIEQVIMEPPGWRGPKVLHRPAPKSGTIYFLAPMGGPIKIGFASRLMFRLNDLRLANPYPLELMASVEGPPSVERDYHRRFAAHRLHGEWFAPHPEILAEIDRLNGEPA